MNEWDRHRHRVLLQFETTYNVLAESRQHSTKWGVVYETKTMLYRNLDK